MDGRKRIDNWRRYLPAKADNNGMYVVTCNACRDNEKEIVFEGEIAVYGPKRETFEGGAIRGRRWRSSILPERYPGTVTGAWG